MSIPAVSSPRTACMTAVAVIVVMTASVLLSQPMYWPAQTEEYSSLDGVKVSVVSTVKTFSIDSVIMQDEIM